MYKVLGKFKYEHLESNPLLPGVKNDWATPILEEAILKSPMATYQLLERYKLKISAKDYSLLVDEVRWNF